MTILADFGVAGMMDTKRCTMTGTPYFIAPEVILDEGEGYDCKVRYIYA
jgi:serine/threonine protein kinase